jgi:hypothetical protein
MPAAPVHVTGVDEITRHEGPSVKCSWPVVVVSSEYVPSALAVNVPVTASMPVTGADGQPAPTSDRSRAPLTARHDDATVHVPTTLPPHAVTFGQDAPPPPLPPRPVVPALAPAPVDPPRPALHPAETSPTASANTGAAERSFMTTIGVARSVLLQKSPAARPPRPWK